VLLCTVSLALAAGQSTTGSANTPSTNEDKGMPEETTMNEDKGTNTDTSQGQDSPVAVQNKGENTKIQTREQVQAELGSIKAEMAQQRQAANTESGEKKGNSVQNQNEVRIAAQTLSKLAPMMGGIGKDISTIAKEFNNSVQATINAEEKIQTKSGFAKFFSGGDKEAARTLKAEAEKNQERLQKLKEFKESCACDEEVKTIMQEQITLMEQEQTRLGQVADKELNKKGLFGWMKK
jgi:hypothetical protein